ncbi:hypothetical protein G7054_g4734 [Neopestalotiopsis clavispora]|nr:hypothetical protein G7054_g4734 [Neopestalotiopsis clavispora]
MADITLGIIGIGIGLPALAEICAKTYRHLLDKAKSYRQADQDVENIWLELEVNSDTLDASFSVLRQYQESLPAEVEESLRRVLMLLNSLIVRCVSKLEQSYGSRTNKVKFSIVLQNELRAFMKEFERWHERFVSRMLLMVLVTRKHEFSKTGLNSNPGVRIILSPGISPISSTTGPQELKVQEIPTPEALKKIPFSSTYTSEQNHRCLIEYRYYGDKATFEERMWCKTSIQFVANILPFENKTATTEQKTEILQNRSNHNHLCSIPTCIGYYDDKASYRFGLVTEVSARFQGPPRSLQAILCGQSGGSGLRHDLNDRVELAKSLASALLALQTAGFVHKSIRPANILMFNEKDAGQYPNVLGKPVLVGFDRARPSQQESERQESDVLEEKVYRHPSRQVATPDSSFSLLHDVYSLGVVLLEVSIWRSSIKLNEEMQWVHNPDFWGNLLSSRLKTKDPLDVASLYLKLVKKIVPRYVGARMASVIERCLTCSLEDDDETDNNESAMLSIRYVEEVMASLEEINL